MNGSKRLGTAKSRSRGLERAFAILDYLHGCKEAQRPIEIAVGMSAPKSSIYELVGLLTGMGVLERVDTEGRVYLGRKLHYLGLSYIVSFDLTRLAQPKLEFITKQTRETSQLCMRDGNKYTVVMMNEGNRQFRISADVGERTPIPWTASGRLLLGHLSDDEIIELVPDDDFVLPNGSRLKKSDYLRSIRKAWDEKFFSFDSLADNYTHCFAAAVVDANQGCSSTLCIVAPKEDAKANYDQYKEVLLRSASELTAELGADDRQNNLAAE